MSIFWCNAGARAEVDAFQMREQCELDILRGWPDSSSHNDLNAKAWNLEPRQYAFADI
jgi:hypothetical protein